MWYRNLCDCCQDIDVLNKDDDTPTTKTEVFSFGFTDFNLVGDLVRTPCDGTIEKEGPEADKKMKKVDLMDLIVDDLPESLLPFRRALNVAFGDTSEAKDGFDILDCNLGYKLVYFNDAFHVKIPLQTVMENSLEMDIEAFVFAFAESNTWKYGELRLNTPIDILLLPQWKRVEG